MFHPVSDGHFRDTLSSLMVIGSAEKEQSFEKYSFTNASSTYHVLMYKYCIIWCLAVTLKLF